MAEKDRTVLCNPSKRFRAARSLDEEAKVLAAAVTKNSSRQQKCRTSSFAQKRNMEKFLEFDIAITDNFETNDSDIIYILLQRRLDASCIIFKLKIRIIRIYSFNYNGPRYIRIILIFNLKMMRRNVVVIK
jgi:hypothetical protein